MRAVDRDACGIGFVADAHGRASHAIVRAALGGLAEVSHRGALAADARSTDGSGLLCAIPPAVFGRGPGGTPHGVAMLFARGEDPRAGVEEAARAEGITVVDWRHPPTDDDELGGLARASRPRILQAVLEAPAADERAAYRLRRRIERGVAATYVVSCSFRTVTYKGLVAAPALGRFYPDLQDPAWVSPFAVFHQRFSTNTLPTWERAQPYRTLCHNGEINTLAGNQARMRARSFLGTEEAGLGPEALFQPVLDEADSDSGQLDAAVELLCRGGRDVRHAVAMLVPEAWEGARELPASVLGFYRYHACLMEPWDGPAGLIFTDGAGVGAALDRNGLRPLRFAICEDGLVACCSEAGAVDLSGHGRVRRGRLGPGQMLFVDPAEGTFLDAECKDYLATLGPYARWADDGLQAQTLGQPVQEPPPAADLVRHQVTQGVSVEELRMVTKPLAAEGKEPTFSMGDDVPLPSLAGRPRPLHHFFRQRFAQVTNPAIDHLRERLVMSLRTVIGPRRPLLDESPEAAHLLEVPSFFLYPSAVDRLLDRYQCPFRSQALDATFALDEGPGGLEAAVDRLGTEAEAAVADGVVVLVATNRPASPARVPVPALLATGAIHHRLVDAGLRTRAGLVVVADDARDTHHLACLLGYGADAICPRLALETVAADADASEEALSAEAQENFRTGIEDGVLKILSKMGISTVDSYRAAQIFEAVGLAPEVVDRCFRGTPAPLGGLSWEALGEDALARHAAAR
ncbi:MAG TPA: glutamate synthase central domain-containing protein, partial [Acidimicrobiales bacterium]|nr:glutamate synthase central domain-containing protein [Acidimicrobiales bacterium]